MIRMGSRMEVALPKTQEIQDLLGNLMAGADQPIFSADDWALRLGDGPLARRFLSQMRCEWLPISVCDDFCQQIMDKVRAHLSSWHPGWPHLWGHILRVTGTAQALAPEAGVDPEHAFLLGILHDIGKLDELRTGVDHELIGALMAHKMLHDYPERCPAPLVERITAAIAKRGVDSDPFVQVLYDADKLDKIGATGIARRLSTEQGPNHVRFALRVVELDLEDFPEMHFATSRRLVKGKREYTKSFIAQVRSVVMG
jgi:putative nucleotidyltransferase with HDIG domain